MRVRVGQLVILSSSLCCLASATTIQVQESLNNGPFSAAVTIADDGIPVLSPGSTINDPTVLYTTPDGNFQLKIPFTAGNSCPACAYIASAAIVTSLTGAAGTVRFDITQTFDLGSVMQNFPGTEYMSGMFSANANPATNLVLTLYLNGVALPSETGWAGPGGFHRSDDLNVPINSRYLSMEAVADVNFAGGASEAGASLDDPSGGSPTSIPEPGTIVLCAGALLLCVAVRALRG